MTGPADLAAVGALCLAGRLGWADQLCLKTHAAAGHAVSLFSYGPVAGIPAGVSHRAAREILEPGPILDPAAADPVLFADLFRLHLLHRCPAMIWVDLSSLCLAPLNPVDGYLFAPEQTGAAQIGTAILALPAKSPVLADMLAFTADPFAIPPFAKPELRRAYVMARADGKPVHVSRQPAGVWGGLMLAHFIAKHRLQDRAFDPALLYPLAKSEQQLLEKPQARVLRRLGLAVRAVQMGQGQGALRPPAGSYLAELAAHHGIRLPKAVAGAPLPDPAPVPASAWLALLAETGLGSVALIADIGGQARDLVLATQARFDCDVLLVDVAADGRFGRSESGWIAPYLVALAAQGVAAERIRVARKAEALRPADLVCCLADRADHALQPGALAPVLKACLHADSRLIADIRKGSGGYKVLNAMGEVQTLSKREERGQSVARVLLSPKAPAPVADDGGWAAIARDLAGAHGFYRANASHSFLFIPRGPVLVVTFDNLDLAMGKREDRRPWGFSFVEKQGFSMLGVMANGWTWYRDPWVSDQFDQLAASGFFAGFDRVVFYGASMGGYAACAFSGAAPGADVVAISPQSTVDRRVVPWETRYKTVWDADFSGKYGDAALVSGSARRVTLLYDPFEPLDAGHANRFTLPNTLKLRANLMGHRLGSSLLQMGILTPIILEALGGTLTEAGFYRLLRARRGFPRYQRELFHRLVAHGHPGLARKLGDYLLRQSDNRAIRQAMAAL